MKVSKTDLKPKLGKYYILILSIIIIVVLIAYFCILKVDTREYVKYVLNLKASVLNDSLLKLKNANTIANLPDIALSTNNNDINDLVNCKNKLTYLGPYTENEDALKSYTGMCKTTCGGAGELLMLEHDDEYVFNNTFMGSGIYCTVEPAPCNLNTGYVVGSVNSVVCKSKYPRLFGGPTASTIIACNDEKYPSTGSVLWDYANNEAVDPAKVLMTHENETLPDGSYRFRCKYNLTKNKNPFIPHPLDRFHPIEDKCNNSIVAASYSVHAVVNEDSWFCECGQFSETRVKHLDESDPKSVCTSCYRDVIKGDVRVTPYMCFKETAPFSMPKTVLPCIEYSGSGNLCSTVKLTINTSDTDDNLFINTPMHDQITQANLLTNYKIY